LSGAAGVLLWAYQHAMEYIVIWTGNIPDEVEWYLVRTNGLWGAALTVLFTGQFVVPFLLLLSARVRRSRVYLIGLAGLTLCGPHLPRFCGPVARIDPHNNKLVLPARRKAGLFERASDHREHRTAQRLACVVDQNQHGWNVKP
jgi:hypothetical protein